MNPNIVQLLEEVVADTFQEDDGKHLVCYAMITEDYQTARRQCRWPVMLEQKLYCRTSSIANDIA